MSNEFTRQFMPINFESSRNQIVDIYLRLSDVLVDRWDNNTNNTLRFDAVKNILTSNTQTCYFQKMKPEQKTQKSNHNIFIQLDDNCAISLKVSLWTVNSNFTSMYSYMIHKAKEIPFIKFPDNDSYSAECRLHFLSYNEQDGSTNKDFQELYQEIEKLNIPKVEVNKEKDKSIWKSYVTALKKLVKEKEQVWKIKKISKPYQEDYVGDERPSYIDIYINEKEICKAFEKEIEHFFDDELDDYGVNDENAFIEFPSFRELSQNEKEQLESMALEYFYEFDPQPTHTISGEINFNQPNDESIGDVYEKIRQYLESEYKITMSIGKDGKITCSEKDIPHILNFIQRRYGEFLSVEKQSSIKLKVSFPSSNEERINIADIKKVLLELGLSLDRTKVGISKDGRQISISVSSFIRSDTFADLGLRHVKKIFSFGSWRSKATQPIDGLYIDDGKYCVDDIRIEQAKKLLELIQKTLSDSNYKILPTQYIFELPEPTIDIEILRAFKTAVDNDSSRKFSINTSELIVDAASSDEYEKLITEAQGINGAFIENKSYQPIYYIKLKENLAIEQRDSIRKIQNELRKLNYDQVSFDPIKNFSRTLFNFNYDSESERDNFVEKMQQICDEIGGSINLTFDNKEGSTSFHFHKNTQLEAEREKEIKNNIRQAQFIYLTKEQYQAYKQAVNKYGDDANFKDGISIGTLVRKEREKFKFRLQSVFEEVLEREDISSLSDGFIKPIFPGELTNIGRMIKAMKKVTDPESAGYPANVNLSNFIFDPNAARLPQADIEQEKATILSNLNEPLLRNQPKQLDAVAKALISPDIAVIQGPPGTGKTTVIAEIIWQTLLRNPAAKILITSQTNLAVDNALERLKGKKLVRPIRIGNIEKFEDEGKVYSDKRIKNWLSARSNSEEEHNNADNAVCQWISNVVRSSSNEKSFEPIIEIWAKGLAESNSLIKTTFAAEYLKQVNVFAATCSECGSRNFSEMYQSIFLKDKEIQGEPIFDLVIMDEASKATPPELILPLTLGKKVVVIGDHKQLPPMIDENEFSEALEAVGAKKLVEDWTKTDYKTSQFEKLFVNAPRSIVSSLDTQFRMHEQIMNCITQFYQDQEELENGLICGIKDQMDDPNFENKASRWHGFHLDPFIQEKTHAIWVNVDTPEEKIGTSYQNKGEIDAIKIVLNALTHAKGFNTYLEHCKKDEDKEIGVITYYMPQMQNIRQALYPHFGRKEWLTFEQYKYNNDYNIPFRINTVDRFQGMERNIIIISTVRSNKQKTTDGKFIKNEKYPYALGFARELQRVNVGFSRAKRLLIVIGNEKHFSNKVEYAEAIQKMHRIDINQLQNL